MRTKGPAIVNETVVQGRYGIPTILFVQRDAMLVNVTFDQAPQMPRPTDRGKEGARNVGYACEITALRYKSQRNNESHDAKSVLHISRMWMD